jgi:hypothetical protein
MLSRQLWLNEQLLWPGSLSWMKPWMAHARAVDGTVQLISSYSRQRVQNVELQNIVSLSMAVLSSVRDQESNAIK